MRPKKLKIMAMGLILLGGVVFFIARLQAPKENGQITKEIIPVIGAIQNTISTTGTVLPKNRLEIKPPVNGRVEEILVVEGEKVKVGQTLAWMSSTERAALLDAAQGQGEKVYSYWKDVYKAIPLISPIDGEVIVATTQPGQTVTTSDAVIVLSDHLIVRAQVDETDIGKISNGQKASLTLDAYPETKIKASVEHIYYESKTVNNVTIYAVDLLPENVPPFFRSGMNSTINFVEKSKENTLILPQEAVFKEKDKNYCLVKEEGRLVPAKRVIELGLADDKNVEVLSGITKDDVVILKTKKYSLPKGSTGVNPFMPGRKKS